MWLLSPLTIFDESIVKQSCIYPFIQKESSSWILNAMSHIISTHPGPITTCHFILPDWHNYRETLVNLLKILTLKGIRNLLIDLKDFEVPCFVFECDSLVDVQLRGCSTPARLPAHRGIFPNLRKLTLTKYDMDNELLVNLLSSRSIIELALVGCYGFNNVVIESDSLRKFYYKYAEEYWDVNLTIKNCPNLDSFKCDNLMYEFKVVILDAPKLKILSHIVIAFSMLQLGNHRFDFYHKYVKISGEITYMSSLRSLDIEVDFDRACYLKSFPHFLICFPCLETLVVRAKSFSDGRYYRIYESQEATDAGAIVIDANYDDHVHLMSNINCLNRHLKNVRLSNYHGTRVQLDFARLIVANAKVLETLTVVYGDDFEGRWMKAQKHFLMQNRASEMLQVEFLRREKSHCFIVCDERNWKNDQKKMDL